VAVDILGHEFTANTEHQVLKIKLKGGGEEYILDLSGAQYGYHEPVISWVDYIESRAGAAWGDIDCKLCNRGFGGGRHSLLLAAKRGIPKAGGQKFSHLTQIAYNHFFFSVEFDKGAVRWEKDHGLTVGEMLPMAPDAFEFNRKQLVKYITNELRCRIGEARKEYAKGSG